MNALPKPDCELGYTRAQVETVVGPRLETFDHWMRGQTVALCEGRLYNHATKEYEEACGGVSHGIVIYGDDLRQFLRGGRPLD